jgi:hypothetical protein
MGKITLSAQATHTHTLTLTLTAVLTHIPDSYTHTHTPTPTHTHDTCYRGKLTLLAPGAGPLPSTVLVLGTVTWLQ